MEVTCPNILGVKFNLNREIGQMHHKSEMEMKEFQENGMEHEIVPCSNSSTGVLVRYILHHRNIYLTSFQKKGEGIKIALRQLV